MRVGVIIFPGSNCDHDAYYVCKHRMGWQTRFIWHKETELGPLDLVILPGGFSYGDYLRSGAIARFSPVMREVVRFAQRGGYVLGICNGFQILTEAGLLPGALLRNSSLRFVCRDVYVRVERTDTAFTRAYAPGAILQLPIAHGEGNYTVDPETLRRLEEEGRIAFRYVTADGRLDPEANPNGSLGNIAGVLNERGNVLGMMPHPERAADPELGRTDGLGLFVSLAESLVGVAWGP
ncbi:MAG: phosphoribosylformylglycinamidine synthase subunit PurQ [Bacteroidetes bacterium]|nr:phosphoribosylformylglycinamidine synthase subunit PurQ [Rhodothermia bacterium]MCS7154484.1 phosphoribosylformylglycinamidine synthase subunit PurQ [Bacteroidota bacterium]MCX7906857.1 phosphoribosylformylglycinamidine synthase subunit PurQ [Bacteroidota bacterium]MDW8136864.1 phosphoribosylformylglycinamidine synthase subunit PurQ [Bacteroidota bacterium]MDW8285266.1 phosphoribosylformylglycinamidine synthase subunit PurQ [Bacteroidota bacterium]